MRKTLAVLLAVVLVLGLCSSGFAAVPGALPTQPAPRTMTQTVAEGGAPSSTVGKAVNKGDFFDIVFGPTAFNWTGEGTTYSFTGFADTWVKLGVADVSVEFVSTTTNAETGGVTVRLKATAASSGTVTLSLNSGATATTATAAFSKTITVKDPEAEKKAAEEEERKREEASRAAEEEAARKASEAAEAARQEEARRASESAEEARRASEAASVEAASQASEAASRAEADRLAREAAQRNTPAPTQSPAATQDPTEAPTATTAPARPDWSLELRSSGENNTQDPTENTSAPSAPTSSDPATSEPTAGNTAPAPRNEATGTPLATSEATTEATTAATAPVTQPTYRTMTGTVAGGGKPASTVGGKIKVGDVFDVVFDRSALNWTGEATAPYSFDGFKTDWVVITGPESTVPVERVGVLQNADGSVSVRMRATRAYDKDLIVYIDSGSGKTEEFARKITIEGEAVPTAHTMTQTVAGGGNPTSAVAAAIAVNSTFDVVFERGAFEWSAAGNGTYNFASFTNDWVAITPANAPVKIDQVTKDTATGKLTVRLRATGAFEGTLSVALDSGSRATAACTKVLSISAADSKIVRTKAGGTAPSVSHAGPATVSVGDKITVVFPENNFEWDKVGSPFGGTLTDKTWIKVTGANTTNDFQVSYQPISGSGDVRVELVPLRAADHKNVQVYLQGGNGAATTASAAMNISVKGIDSGRITGIAADAYLGGTHSGAYLNGRAISYAELSSLEVRPEDELLLPLRAGFFTWSGKAPYPNSAVTKSQLSSGKIKVLASGRSGSRVFTSDTPDLYASGGQMYVRIEFAKDIASTKDQDFAMTVNLTVDGARHSNSALELAGTLVRDIYEVDEGDSYFDLSDGAVVEATRYVKDVELYLGSDVTALANLSSGRKYSGTATTDLTAGDERLLEKYPDIDHVITLKTSGLTGSNCKIQLDLGSEYYVYNEDLDYIGRSGEKLPYSAKYYLATRKLNIDEDDVVEVDEDEPDWDDDDDTDEPDWDDVVEEPPVPVAPAPPTNANGIPKTGR